MSSAFYSLTLGSSTVRRKPQHASERRAGKIDTEGHAKSKSQSKGKEKIGKVKTHHDKPLPSELDFFGSHSHTQAHGGTTGGGGGGGGGSGGSGRKAEEDKDEEDGSRHGKRRKLAHEPSSSGSVSSSRSSSDDEEESEDADEDDDDEEPTPAPPIQKITISSPSSTTLPRSFPSFLSLLSHTHSHQPHSHDAPSDRTEPTRRMLATNMNRHGWRTMWGVQGAVSGGLMGYGLDHHDDAADEGKQHDVDRTTRRSSGCDMLVVAPTGSGKTLSYLLPLILKLGLPARTLLASTQVPQGNSHDDDDVEDGTGIRAIVLLPTHELATQIHNEVLKLVVPARSASASHSHSHAEDEDDAARKSKTDQAWRVMLLEKATEAAVIASSSSATATSEQRDKRLGIDVLVATPERLHSLVDKGKVDLGSTRYLILDEADRLLSSQFIDQTRPIVAACSHPAIQKAFLSATMESGPETEARRLLKDGGVRVVVGVKDAATTTIDQTLTFCGSEQGKLLALRSLITSGSLPPPTLIFVQSIDRANQLYRQLLVDGTVAEVGVVHSERSKAAREQAVREFREGKVWMLVVTELMARGLDFKGVEVVVNYDFPQTVQSYIHRIGRTGRAGRKGKAITFFTLEDGPYLRTIANVMRTAGCPVEPWMLELPKPTKNMKKERRKAPLKRKNVGGGDAERLGKRELNKRRDMIEASKKRKLKQAAEGGAGGAGVKKTGNRVEVDLSE